MKKIVFILLVLSGILTGCSAVPQIESSYDNVEAYSQYLKKAEGNGDLIEAYFEQTEDGFMLNLYNGNEVYWMSEVTVLDADSNKIGEYKTSLVAPCNYYFGYDVFEVEPVRFIQDKDEFYVFEYPDLEKEYSTIYDITQDYSTEWINVLLQEDCSLENVEIVSKYQYASGVITDMYYYAYYFYDDNVEMYYDAEYDEDYPDPISAVYAAGLDYEEKTITIFELVNEEFKEVKQITME